MDQKKFDVIAWMAKYGHPSYKIAYGKAETEEEKEEIYQEAYDRYIDWVTDPLD